MLLGIAGCAFDASAERVCVADSAGDDEGGVDDCEGLVVAVWAFLDVGDG